MSFKKIPLIIIACVVFLISRAQDITSSLSGLLPDSNHKTTITLLGTYHFANPNLDQFNVKSDNVLLPQRQTELEALVKELARFNATKIVLEYDRNSSDADQRYAKYLRGEYVLESSESEQIGFRLAKLLGHPHVYPADERSIEVDFNPGALAEEFGPVLQQLSVLGETVISQINSWVNDYSIGGVLHRLNSEIPDQLNIDLYYRFLLPVGNGDYQPGVEAVARWYKRNLYILRHIKEIAGTPGTERVLVIFGQGHTAMLKQFLQHASDFRVVDIRQYLPKD